MQYMCICEACLFACGVCVCLLYTVLIKVISCNLVQAHNVCEFVCVCDHLFDFSYLAHITTTPRALLN